MSLVEVVNQSEAQRVIQRAVLSDRVPHAYLFHGPDGVGKEKLAVGLAELLLCEQPVDEVVHGDRAEDVGAGRLRVGCGRCEACRGVAARTHPDLHLVYRQLNREHPNPEVRRRKALEIGVEVLRHFVIAKVGLTPALGRAKVFIVREADRMTVQAQNALLKTLEEPPGATVIILLVAALDRLLPTTLSRCQVVRFDALPTEFVRSKLAQMLPDLPTQQVEWYARISEGSLGRALQHAGDALYEVNRRLLEGFAELSRSRSRMAGWPMSSDMEDPIVAEPALLTSPSLEKVGHSTAPGPRSDELTKAWINESKGLGGRYHKRDPDISETEASRRGLKSVLQLAATWYADILRFGSGDSPAVVNASRHTLIEQAGETVGRKQAIEAINHIAQAEHQLDLNANTQLCVETLVNNLSRISNHEPVPTA